MSDFLAQIDAWPWWSDVVIVAVGLIFFSLAGWKMWLPDPADWQGIGRHVSQYLSRRLGAREAYTEWSRIANAENGELRMSRGVARLHEALPDTKPNVVASSRPRASPSRQKR